MYASREARKHEHVPYKFQTTDAEILVGNFKDFLVCEESTIDRFHVKTDVEERIMVQNTKFPAQNGDCLESFHHPRGGVGILPDNRSKINVEVVYHDIAEFGQADVRSTVFVTKEI